jgi:hypothetical protein
VLALLDAVEFCPTATLLVPLATALVPQAKLPAAATPPSVQACARAGVIPNMATAAIAPTDADA